MISKTLRKKSLIWKGKQFKLPHILSGTKEQISVRLKLIKTCNPINLVKLFNRNLKLNSSFNQSDKMESLRSKRASSCYLQPQHLVLWAHCKTNHHKITVFSTSLIRIVKLIIRLKSLRQMTELKTLQEIWTNQLKLLKPSLWVLTYLCKKGTMKKPIST